MGRQAPKRMRAHPNDQSARTPGSRSIAHIDGSARTVDMSPASLSSGGGTSVVRAASTRRGLSRAPREQRARWVARLGRYREARGDVAIPRLASRRGRRRGNERSSSCCRQIVAESTLLRLLLSEARTARRARTASGRSLAQRFAPPRSEHADRGQVAGAARAAPRAPTVAVVLLGSPHPLSVRRFHTCVAHCRMGTRPASCTTARQASLYRTCGIVLAKSRAPRSRTSSTRAARARRIAAGHARASRAPLRETSRGARRQSCRVVYSRVRAAGSVSTRLALPLGAFRAVPPENNQRTPYHLNPRLPRAPASHHRRSGRQRAETHPSTSTRHSWGYSRSTELRADGKSRRDKLPCRAEVCSRCGVALALVSPHVEVVFTIQPAILEGRAR